MNILLILTILICATCLVIGVCGWSTFMFKSGRLLKDIKSANGVLPSSLSTQKLKDVTSDYQKTIRNGKHSSEYASDYINIDSCAAAYGMNLKVIKALPNILTSIGILGTFIGLTVALLQFDSNTSEKIRESINSLLGGMSTAFLTSVFGMASSALFLFLERKRINRIENAVQGYATDLDAAYHASGDQVLVDSLSYSDAAGNITTPGAAIASICGELATLNKGISNLKDDITTAMELAIGDAFDKKVVPALDNLATKLENPAQAVTDSLVKELGAVCETFKNGLTESVNKQMEELLERFIDASNAIRLIPEAVEQVNKNITDASEHTIEANKEVARSIEEQAIRLNDLSVSFAESLTKIMESADSISDVHDSLADMPLSLRDASNAIVASTGSLAGTNAQITAAIDSMQKANDTTRDSVDAYTNDIKAVETGLQSIFAQINTGLTQYTDTAKAGLQNMLDPFTTSISTATEKVANSIAPLADAVDELSTFGDKVSKVIKDLEIALKPIEKSIIDLSKKADKINNANTI